MKKDRNDNKDGQRGDYYQALVALKYALEYTDKSFDTLILEHQGDITFDAQQQIEVKHHSPKCSLGDCHVDFWNTLYNWCLKGDKYEKLVLHTTAYYPKSKSLLKTWNKQSIDCRYTTIKDIIKSNTAQGVQFFMTFIDEMDQEKLKSVISKIEIKIDQSIDSDLVSDLTLNPVIQSISCKPEDREYLIKNRLAGFIQGKIVGENKWQISRKQLFSIIQEIARDFLNETYNPIFDKYFNSDICEKEYHQYNEKRFVKELGIIQCEEEEIREAINDFWKTNTLLAEETENNPTFIDNEFQPYKKDKIYPSLKNKKRISSMERINDSLYFYRQAKDLNIGLFKRIPDYPYFKHGTMQLIIEDDDLNFSWLYE